MQFPGNNKLLLTDAAICAAIAGALNATRLQGEDYVYVTDFSRNFGGGGDWVATITTDPAPGVAIVSITDAEAA
jgi:hypothetical protein